MKKTLAPGFSLLELLIVMAISAVLISIAYPVYTSHLQKGRRAQAEIGLLHLAGRLESFYSLNDSYQGATLEALGVNADTDDHSYQLTIQSIEDSRYTIAALPSSPPAKQDAACGALSLNETGERMSSGTADAKTCW